MSQRRNVIHQAPGSFYEPIRVDVTSTAEGIMFLSTSLPGAPIVSRPGETISFTLTPSQNASTPLYSTQSSSYVQPGLAIQATYTIQNTYNLTVERVIYLPETPDV